jgi:hypothetical protein
VKKIQRSADIPLSHEEDYRQQLQCPKHTMHVYNYQLAINEHYEKFAVWLIYGAVSRDVL